MKAQTLCITQPAHLSCQYGQMVIYLKAKKEECQYPIADLGIVVLDHPTITVTHQLLASLGEAHVAVIFCNRHHLPSSIMLPYHPYFLPASRMRLQIASSKPLRKKLWQRTVKHKIAQQSQLLTHLHKEEGAYLQQLMTQVTSGDTTHCEAQAAKRYWKALFGPAFCRLRHGPFPNLLLNYGYALVRAAMARALARHGLLNLWGIHHSNQYNAFCLADDMMEPYRPFVDALVYHLVKRDAWEEQITTEQKRKLLSVLTQDCLWQKERTTVGSAMEQTAISLAHCFEKKRAELLTFPTYYVHSNL